MIWTKGRDLNQQPELFLWNNFLLKIIQYSNLEKMNTTRLLHLKLEIFQMKTTH